MADVLVTEVATNFDSSLPVLLPPVGKSGYFLRTLASQLAGVDGSAVPAWSSVVDAGTPYAFSVSGGSPTLKTQGADKFVRLDGVDDRMLVPLPATQGLAMVFRKPSGSFGGIANDSGVIIQRASTGHLQANGSSGSIQSPTTFPTDKWVVMVLSVATDAFRLRVDGSAGTGTPGISTLNRIHLGFTSNYGAVDVAEVVTWAGPLTVAEMSAIEIQLKANHPELFPV